MSAFELDDRLNIGVIVAAVLMAAVGAVHGLNLPVSAGPIPREPAAARPTPVVIELPPVQIFATRPQTLPTVDQKNVALHDRSLDKLSTAQAVN